MNAQLKKGVLELCVLEMLRSEDHYGYELVAEISRSIAISEGTIYPLLRRLQNEGYLSTYLKESTEGPPRKYYRLTPLGEEKRKEYLQDWRTFVSGVEKIIGGHSE